MKLSILIPVYNERTVVERSITLVMAAPLPENMERELVVVDDCSTDGTFEILKRLAQSYPEIRLFRHEKNAGKGAAVRTAIGKAEGDFSLIQDADLEYDPAEYPRLLKPLLDGHADAVFGSRYLAGEQTRVLPFWHSMMNKGLTLVSNMFCNLNLTDMETCYKVFRTDLLKSVPIRSNRFGFEPEITMKSAKRKFRIYEVPISYHGRTYEEGKKIGWKDGVKALCVIVRYWLIDDLYAAPYGRGVLNNLTGTPQYLSWLARRRYGARNRRRHRQSLGAADVATAAVRRGGKGPSAPARAAQPLPAHAECGGAAARSGAAGRHRGHGALLRYGAVRQRAGVPRRPAAGSGGCAGRAETRRIADRARAAGSGAIRQRRSPPRPQAPLPRRRSPEPAGRRRLRGGNGVPVQ